MSEYRFPRFKDSSVSAQKCGCTSRNKPACVCDSGASTHLDFDSSVPTKEVICTVRPIVDQLLGPSTVPNLSGMPEMLVKISPIVTKKDAERLLACHPMSGQIRGPVDSSNSFTPRSGDASKGGDYFQFKNVDCTPPYKTIYIKTFQCGEGAIEVLGELHYRAYRVALTAWRTLNRLALLEESTRQIVWNWGAAGSVWKILWGYDGYAFGEENALRDSLAFWFGPYSTSNFNHVREIFYRLKKVFEQGVEVSGIFYWMRYKCKSKNCAGGAPARHLVSWTIDICHSFWDDYKWTQAWLRNAMVTILHENLHNLLGPLSPRDERVDGVCTGGWNSSNNMCYRATAGDDNWRNYGFMADNPRKLIEKNRIGAALNNVDNYTSWALRRYTSPWFGECDLPYWPKYAHGKPSK